jgi:ribonuclease Z
MQTPEVAVTGDTSVDFVDIPENHRIFQAKLLIMECTFLDATVDQAGARERGHMHIKDITANADKFKVRQTRSECSCLQN